MNFVRFFACLAFTCFATSSFAQVSTFYGSDAQFHPIHVASNSALKALTAGSLASVIRDGYTTAGDGGSANYIWSSSACSLNSGAGDNGSQVAPASGTGCWVADFSKEMPSVMVWGAVGNGSTDDSTALNAAFASGVPVVRLPTKTFFAGSALTTQVSIKADGQSNANYNGTTSQPNGAYIQCANTVTTCLTVSTATSGSSGRGGLIVQGFAVGFAGTPGAGATGLTVSSMYQAIVRDVQVFNAVNGFKILHTNGGWGITSYLENVATCAITGAHLLMDGEPEVRVSSSRFGCNNSVSLDTASTAYVQIQNSSTDPGPNTLYVVNSQFNTGQGSAPNYVSCGLNFIGITSASLEWTFIGNHMENANQLICSDSGTTQINELNFVGNEFDSRGAYDAFNLNAATGINHWRLTSNTFKAWLSFTLAPANSFQDFTATGNQFHAGVFSLTGVSGCNVDFENNIYYGLTVAGAFGQAKFTGLDIGVVTNSSTSPVELSFTNGSGGKEWTLFTPGISFGGGSTGITYSVQFGRYKIVGSLVTVQLQLSLSAVGSSTGNASITGLPFTVNAAHGASGTGTVPSFYNNFSGLTGVVVLSPSGSSTILNIDQTGATGLSAVTNSAFTSSSAIQAQFSYPIN